MSLHWKGISHKQHTVCSSFLGPSGHLCLLAGLLGCLHGGHRDGHVQIHAPVIFYLSHLVLVTLSLSSFLCVTRTYLRFQVTSSAGEGPLPVNKTSVRASRCAHCLFLMAHLQAVAPRMKCEQLTGAFLQFSPLVPAVTAHDTCAHATDGPARGGYSLFQQ